MIRAVLIACLATVSAFAQAVPDKSAQIEAMKKLSFMIGKWEGEATVRRGPGEPTKIRQSEDVQYRLDGLIILIEGTGRDPVTGAKVFNAIATISFDDAAKKYRIRAYNDGRYIDTEMEVTDNGYAWGIDAGAARVRYTMKLNDKGEWNEVGDVTMGERTFRTVDMTVRKQ
jgi:hypothetical protein